jgi:hypothetical protein
MSGSVPRTGIVSGSSVLAEADGRELLPEVALPEVALPEVALPEVELPEVELPGVPVLLGDAVLPGVDVLGVGRMEFGS